MPKTLGTKNMIPQPVKWRWDPQKGGSTDLAWRGHRDNAGQITPILIAAGYVIDVENGPGELVTIKGTKNAIDPATAAQAGANIPPGLNPSEVVNTWELVPNKATKDILHADCSAIAALSATQVEELIKARKDGAPPTAWNNSTLQLPIWKLMNAGVEHWEIDQPVLRHTFMVPQSVNPGLAFANVGKILSTATLFSAEGLPGAFVVPVVAVTAQFTNPTRTDGVSLAYGWRKQMPTLTVAPYGKQEVHAEYQFGLWSTVLYGTAI